MLHSSIDGTAQVDGQRVHNETIIVQPPANIITDAPTAVAIDTIGEK